MENDGTAFLKYPWQLCSLKIYEDEEQWKQIKRRLYWMSDVNYHTETYDKWEKTHPTETEIPTFFYGLDESSGNWHYWISDHFHDVNKHMTETTDVATIEAARKTIHFMTGAKSSTSFDSDSGNKTFEELEKRAIEASEKGFDKDYYGPFTFGADDTDEVDE